MVRARGGQWHNTGHMTRLLTHCRFKTLPLQFLALVGAGSALALDLGEINVLSRIGQPFRAEVPLLEEPGSPRPAGECFRVSKPDDATAGMPTLSQGRISLMRDGTKARLLVVSDRPNYEPILQFNINVVCGPLHYRSYSALIDPETSSPPPVLTSTAPAGKPVEAPPIINLPAVSAKPASSLPASGAGPEWVSSEGESARSIAAFVHPANPTAQQRFLAGLLNANPNMSLGATGDKRLPAGTIIHLPEARHLPSARQGVAQPRIAVPIVTQVREKAPSPTISPATERELLLPLPSLRPSPVPAVVEAAPPVEVAPPIATPPAPALPVAKPTTIPKAPPPPEEVMDEEEPGFIDWLIETVSTWWQEIAAILGVIALLFLWKSVKSRGLRKELTKQDAVQRDPMSVLEDDVRAAAKAPVKTKAVAAGPESVPTAVDHKAPAVAPPQDAMAVAEDHEFNPVMELAEIMLSFGRIKGAAQALQEYIEKNPSEALQPWMKLLEVYRQGEMREEFDSTSENLKLHFNVAPADWDSMADSVAVPVSPVDEETASVDELLAHLPNIARMLRIRDEITRTWDSPEGLDYLNTLLRDNRKGERQGFPLATVTELLYLLGILEKRLKRRA